MKKLSLSCSTRKGLIWYSLFFPSSQCCTWIRSPMWILLALFSLVKKSFRSSYSCFPLCNFIPFLVSLVFGITYIFGFTLTLFVWICTIAGYFTDSFCILICFVFLPILSSSSILSNLYSCTGGGSLIYYHFIYYLLNYP